MCTPAALVRRARRAVRARAWCVRVEAQKRAWCARAACAVRARAQSAVRAWGSVCVARLSGGGVSRLSAHRTTMVHLNGGMPD